MKKRFISVFLILSLGLIFSSNGSAKVIEGIVAIVNDGIITLSDLEKYKDKLKKGTIIDDLLVKPSDVDQVIQSKEKILQLLINERVLDSEVRKQGLQVTFEKVEREISGIASKNNITRDQLKQALAAQGIRFSDYQDFVKTRLERQDLIARAVTSKIKISDDEIASYYSAQNGEKKEEDIFEYTVAHILFRADKGEEAAKEKAKMVYFKLRNENQSFEKLASEYSEDPDFSDGGVLGTFKAGELLESIDRVVQRLKVNDTSKVIKTKAGFHIVKLVAKKRVADPSWVAEQNRIRAILLQQAFQKQFQFWLDQKKEEAFIRINEV